MAKPRFVQTSLREWAYARAYATSNERGKELPRRLAPTSWQSGLNAANQKNSVQLSNLLRHHT
jgi:hypothetical protein